MDAFTRGWIETCQGIHSSKICVINETNEEYRVGLFVGDISYSEEKLHASISKDFLAMTELDCAYVFYEIRIMDSLDTSRVICRLSSVYAGSVVTLRNAGEEGLILTKNAKAAEIPIDDGSLYTKKTKDMSKLGRYD